MRQNSANVIHQLERVFFECGSLHKLHTNNDTAFCSIEFRAFAHDWRINLRFYCAYTPAENGIAERCHRTVKGIAARMRCPIQEAVYWRNVTPKDNVSSSTAPADAKRVKGVNAPTSSGPGHSYYQSAIACGSRRR